MSPDLRRRLFVSYATSDRDFAGKLVANLRTVPGVELTLDTDAAVELADHRTLIHEALRSADLVIPVITTRYLASEWCMAELGAAWMLDKAVVPVVEDNGLLDRLPGGPADPSGRLVCT